MTTTVDPPAVVASPANLAPDFAPLRPAWCLLTVPVAGALAVAALWVAATDDPLAVELVRPAVVAVWALAGLILGLRRRHDRLAPIVLAGAIVGGVGTLAAAVVEHRTLTGSVAWSWDLALRLSAALLPAIAMHLLFGLADGRLATAVRRRAVAAGYVVALVVGAASMADRDEIIVWPLIVLWAAALGFGMYASHVRYLKAGAVDRRRMQWVGWGIAVATEATLVVIALRLLTDWPHQPGAVALGLTGLIPLALALGALPGMVARVDRLLTHTVEIAGLTALVVAIYVVVVIGLGRTPADGERALLLLSMLAAGVCALLYLPARRRLTERANRLVYGERFSPDELLRTFGQRLTRSIPMDELLLQLTESLRKAMVLTSAEVWTGQQGRYDLAAGVPHRDAPTVAIGAKESAVVARAGVSGGTWLDVWIPAIVGTEGSSAMRLAPVAHAGELLGFITVTRRRDGEAFTESEDRVLTDLARQVALALHNMQLDAALQASLDELQLRNRELQQSRARIVAAGDAERRKLERNLHDGAQQHLVALAVKVRLTARRRGGRPRRRHRHARRDQGQRPGRHPGAARPRPRHLPAAARVRGSDRGAACGGDSGGAARPPSIWPGSGATHPTWRRPSTSACSRRCRTPASTPGRAQRPPSPSGRRTTPWRSRWPTTGQGSPPTARPPRGTGSSTWPTGSGPSAASCGCGRRPGRAPRSVAHCR